MRSSRCGFDNSQRAELSRRYETPASPGWDAIASREGERRQLTVMFCDLVGSATLSAQLDPEELWDVISAYHEVCTGVIERLGGCIAQYLGDGVLMYFGFPQAHEDAAQQAVRAGLAIVEEVSGLHTQLPEAHDTPLAVRVGIHTGVVVVETGTPAKRGQLPWGEAPNIAARLQALAEPNSVLISAATARLLRGSFECHDLGPTPIKGFHTPIQVSRVVREQTRRTHPDVAGSAGLTPLVGRAREVDVLLQRLALAKDGLGQIVLLEGEPGIGKTRLLRVLEERVKEESCIWLECRCSPYYQNTALYPVIELVERVLGFTRDASVDKKTSNLEAALKRYPVRLTDVMPPFASLLSLPPPKHYGRSTLGPAAQKQKTMEAVLALLDAMAATSVVLLVVENLQWIDPSTLELLTLFINRVPTTSVLAVFTYRPEFCPPWTSAPHLIRIALGRLDREESETLVQHVARKPLPSDVLEQIVLKTDGIPLFAEELTKMVLESDLLLEREECYKLTGPLPALAIPTTLQDSLMARLDRLPAGRALAQLAATVGRVFSYELIRAVSPFDDGALERELGLLVKAGLLYQDGLPPSANYVFKHALIQDAAYQSLLRSTRQKYHRQIAHALIARSPEAVEKQPELLAHHFTAAGLFGDAIEYWKRAGEQALRRFANLEAIAHLSKGLDLLRNVPTGPEWARREVELQVALIVPLVATRGYGAVEVEKTCVRAGELCQQLVHAPQLFPVLWGLWQFYVVRAQFPRAHDLGRQLLRTAGRDPVFLMLAHEALGVTFFFMGELCESRRHLERTIAHYDPVAHRSLAFLYTQDPDAAARSYLAIVLWALGYPDQAVARSREARDRALDLGHPYTHVFALNLWNWLFLLRRQAQPEHTEFETVLRISNEQQFALGSAMALLQRGWTVGQHGESAEGIAELRRGLAAWQATGARLLIPYYLALLGEAARRAGRIEEAWTVIGEALALAETTGERWYEAELYRLQGELMLAGCGHDERAAEVAFRRAFGIARRQGARMLALRAAVSLARLMRQRSNRRARNGLLQETYHEFTEGHATPDLQDAKALLSVLNRHNGSAGWELIVPREL